MLNIIVFGFWGIIYVAALFGYGRLTETILQCRWPFPFTICLGMACLIFFGGILNLAGIAYPLVLDIIVLLGLGLTAIIFFQSCNLNSLSSYKKQYLTRESFSRFLPSAILIVIVFGCAAYTLSSPRQFNFHDDLEKYMSHPIRMLATGGLRSGPFDVLGGDTFGGQAFLQGFSVAHFPIGYVNTIDTVFAFTLCLICVFNVAARERVPFWLIPVIVALPVFINPQSVNISSNYTASVLLLFLFLGTWNGAQDSNNASWPWPNAASFGLAYASLAVLKTSFVLPAIVHFIVMVAGFICVSREWKNVIYWAAKLVFSFVIFILPWGLIYLPFWLQSLANMNNPGNSFLKSTYFGYAQPASNLFSLNPLHYGFGATFAHYTFMVIFIGVCSVFFLMMKYSNQQVDKVRRVLAFAACATPSILYYIGTVGTTQLLFGQEDALRFLCPVLIASFPATLIMALSLPPGMKQPGHSKNSLLRPKNLIVVLVSIVFLGAFFESFSERVRHAHRYGSILSFPKLARTTGYIEYNQFALSPEAKRKVQKAQQAVPEKERLVAWTPLALHLDYKRNDIISVNPSGLVSPWQDFPFEKGLEKGISYLIRSKKYYVLWQYRGYAVRSAAELHEEAASPCFRHHAIGVRSFQFVSFLKNVAMQSKILYNDGQILVMKLPG